MQKISLIGNARAINYLGMAIRSGNCPPVFMFEGPHHLGQMKLAFEMAKTLNCLNTETKDYSYCNDCVSCNQIDRSKSPAVQIINLAYKQSVTGKKEELPSIGVEIANAIISDSYISSSVASNKIYIFEKGENITTQAANTLLKTFEEPPKNVYFIVLVTVADSLPQTLVSRCQRITFNLLSEELVSESLQKKFAVSKTDAEVIAILSFGRIGWAISSTNNELVIEELRQNFEICSKFANADELRRFLHAFEITQQLKRDVTKYVLLLDDWLLWWRLGIDVSKVTKVNDYFGSEVIQIISPKAYWQVVTEITEAQRALHSNVTPLLCFEQLALRLPKP